MTDKEKVQQALAELWDVVKCRCNEAYTGRGLHDPDCECDSEGALQIVTGTINALTEQLTAAQHDAKEAEAYAEELEKGLNTCRMAQAVMDNTVADLEAKLTKAVALLIEASTDLTAYVDADYPPESCVRYPDIARRHHRDLELVRRIDATLAEIKGENQNGQ